MNRRIAVTGATGFVAEELIRRLISNGDRVNAIARNEGKLVDLKAQFRSVDIYPCPIEDFCLLKKALTGCDGVFHFASFKDVILSHANPLKTVQTNINGTQNLLELSVQMPAIKFMIATSTDKAAKVSSVYGASKLILEYLFQEFSDIYPRSCKYRVVRYGNVFYSTSSVLRKWKAALLRGEEIIITDPSATRFFWTREDAVNLLFECLEKATSAMPYIPSMKAVSIGDLLEAMVAKYGNGQSVNVKTVGIQPGENLHEYLTDDCSSEHAPKWAKEELLSIL